MPLSTLTAVDVANLALDHLAERPITSLDDTTSYARWLKRNITIMTGVFLRLNPWSFAVEYKALTKATTDPAFRWTSKYRLPEGWIRVLPITRYGGREDDLIPFEIADNHILCDQTDTLYVRMVMQNTNYHEWDPLAIDAFGLFLAFRMAMRFTAKAEYRDRLKEDLRDATGSALEFDALEVTPDIVEQHNVIRAREL